MKLAGLDILIIRIHFQDTTQAERLEETWGVGVGIHTVDTRPSLFQFRNQFLVRFVPNKLPLPCADQMVLNDM